TLQGGGYKGQEQDAYEHDKEAFCFEDVALTRLDDATAAGLRPQLHAVWTASISATWKIGLVAQAFCHERSRLASTTAVRLTSREPTTSRNDDERRNHRPYGRSPQATTGIHCHHQPRRRPQRRAERLDRGVRPQGSGIR